MPKPLAPSEPPQLTVKEVVVVKAGRAATLLVGALRSTRVVASGWLWRRFGAVAVGGDAVEAVGVAVLAGVGRRRRRGGEGLPGREGAAVVGGVNLEAGDARAAGVRAGPAHREVGRLDGGG